MRRDKSGVLYGKESVREYLDVTEYILKKLIRMWMPVLIDNGVWIAHADNIEDWFRHQTRLKVSNDEDNLKMV